MSLAPARTLAAAAAAAGFGADLKRNVYEKRGKIRMALHRYEHHARSGGGGGAAVDEEAAGVGEGGGGAAAAEAAAAATAGGGGRAAPSSNIKHHILTDVLRCGAAPAAALSCSRLAGRSVTISSMIST